jgi:integrase/recombinase XerC
MTLPIPEGVVIRHLDHMRVRNLRPSSVYNRQRVLARLARWADGPILYLSEDDLVRWQAARARQISAAALRMEQSNIGEFYRWCVRDRYRADDPALRLDMPRVARRLPRPIPDRALADALAAAEPYTAAILGLAGFAGLRACEIARLDWSEVGIGDKSPHIRVVNGKGGHGRIVPLSSTLAELLSVLPKRRGPVIRRRDDEPGSCQPHNISARANTYLHSLGIPETLHQGRHRFASATYQACRDIRAVQDLLGHASPTSTSIYAAVASGVAVQAVTLAGALDVTRHAA